MLKVLIGLPIFRREWILPKWLEYIEKQTMPLSEIGFIFELGPDDDETHDILWEWQAKHPEVSVFDGLIRADVIHEVHPDSSRTWDRHKYWRMVDFRNNLLDRAVALQPERYFSLDSDILLENPNTIETLYELTGTLDAVSPLTYMFPYNIDFPSVMTWIDGPGKTAQRFDYPIGTLFQADIIMAAVMMSKSVYENTRYQWHKQGEDLGWSFDATRKGYKLWCSSDIYGAHIMYKNDLGQYLTNGDGRSTNKTFIV